MAIFSTNQFCFWKYTSEAISQLCCFAPDLVINKETMECRSLNAVLIQLTSQYAPRWKLQWVACFTQVMWSCHINCQTKLLPPFSSPHLTPTILIGLFKRTLLSTRAFKVSSLLSWYGGSRWAQGDDTVISLITMMSINLTVSSESVWFLLI